MQASTKYMACIFIGLIRFCFFYNLGENNILQILKTKWWKYFLMALTDVEANYTVVKAYQFTTLTSIQVRLYNSVEKKDPHINTITVNIITYVL